MSHLRAIMRLDVNNKKENRKETLMENKSCLLVIRVVQLIAAVLPPVDNCWPMEPLSAHVAYFKDALAI